MKYDYQTERNKKIIELRLNKVAIKDIVERFGLCDAMVRCILDKAGVKVAKFDPDRDKLIVDLWKKDTAVQEIAKKAKVSDKTVFKALERNGIEYKTYLFGLKSSVEGKPVKRKYDHDKIMKLYEAGLSYAEIGRRIGSTASNVYCVVAYRKGLMHQKKDVGLVQGAKFYDPFQK